MKIKIWLNFKKTNWDKALGAGEVCAFMLFAS